MLSQVLMNHKEARVIRDFYSDWQQYEGESTALPQAGMVVLNEFARNYPGTVSEFQRTYAGALEWTVANPAEAAPLVEASASIPAQVFVQSMERTRLHFVPGSEARADVDVYLSRLLRLLTGNGEGANYRMKNSISLTRGLLPLFGLCLYRLLAADPPALQPCYRPFAG